MSGSMLVRVELGLAWASRGQPDNIFHAVPAHYRSLEPPWSLYVPYAWFEEMGRPASIVVSVEAKEQE